MGGGGDLGGQGEDDVVVTELDATSLRREQDVSKQNAEGEAAAL